MVRKIQADSRGNLCNRILNSLLTAKINQKEPCFRLDVETELLKEAQSACSLYRDSLV